ncbi:hypothetical protein BAE44_0017677, partial [Dichanthelium oligosanthes]
GDAEVKYSVVRRQPSGRYAAEIRDPARKTPIRLGTFDSAEAAARAYDAAARSIWGAAARTNFPSTVESWSGGIGGGVAAVTAAGALRGAIPAAAEEDCRSYCSFSSSVLCEDGASCAGGVKAAAAPRCSPLPFNLNVADPEAANDMDWRCDTLLHL